MSLSDFGGGFEEVIIKEPKEVFKGPEKIQGEVKFQVKGDFSGVFSLTNKYVFLTKNNGEVIHVSRTPLKIIRKIKTDTDTLFELCYVHFYTRQKIKVLKPFHCFIDKDEVKALNNDEFIDFEYKNIKYLKEYLLSCVFQINKVGLEGETSSNSWISKVCECC